MLNILISIFAFLLAILLLVLVHEYGHFWVARRLGVKVLRFSIGFGKALWRWHDRRGTEYVIAMLPLGGYVKMLDEREGEEVPPEELHRAFNRKPVLSRLAIVAAGPLVNVIFAILFYWLIFVIGFPVIKPIIGHVVPGSVAAEAGLRPNDQVVSVDGVPTPGWQSVLMRVVRRAGDEGRMLISVRRSPDDQLLSRSLDLTNWTFDQLKPQPIRTLGIVPFQPTIPPIIGGIEPNGVAAQAGLRVGDRIVRADGQSIMDWITLVKLIREKPGQDLRLIIERDGQRQSMNMTVGKRHGTGWRLFGYLGIWPQAVDWPAGMQYEYRLNPLAAIPRACREVWGVTGFTFVIIGKMIVGKLSLRGLGGPITIYSFASTAFKAGLVAYLGFLAFLNIMLAIINILPIPGLDGGHLLLYAVEGIIRRPVPDMIQVFLFRLGIVLLISLMLFAIINDLARLF